MKKLLLNLFFFFVLSYGDKIISTDFTETVTIKDPVTNTIKIIVYGSHSTFDFKEHMNESKFNMLFKVQGYEENYSNLQLIDYQLDSGSDVVRFILVPKSS